MLTAAIRACARRLVAALDPLAYAPRSVLVELCAACGDFALERDSFASWRCYCGAHEWRGLLTTAA